MADLGTLFMLILTALTFVVIGMGFIVYIMIIGEREKKKLKAERIAAATMDTPENCPHYLGYLSEFPKDQPVPDECFGCMKAIQCVNGQREQDDITLEEEPIPEQ